MTELIEEEVVLMSAENLDECLRHHGLSSDLVQEFADNISKPLKDIEDIIQTWYMTYGRLPCESLTMRTAMGEMTIVFPAEMQR